MTRPGRSPERTLRGFETRPSLAVAAGSFFVILSTTPGMASSGPPMEAVAQLAPVPAPAPVAPVPAMAAPAATSPASRAERSQVQASLEPGFTAVTPGQPFPLGVRLVIDPGWHIYWLHPGDAGMPTRVTWKPTRGARLDGVRWPAPDRYLELGGYEAVGYSGEVVLPATLTVTAPTSGSITLQGEVTWLACKDDCVRGSAPITLTLPLGGEARETPARAKIAAFEARVPAAIDPADPFTLRVSAPETLKPGGKAGIDLEVAPKTTSPAEAGKTGSRPAEAGKTGSRPVEAVQDLKLEAAFLHADLSLFVGHEERLSDQKVRIALTVPDEGGPAAGTRLAEAVARVSFTRDGQRVTRYVRLEVPTRLAAPAPR